ncbi:LamG-like jellyroll fold domain-containing protein [Amycolatopsis australiensis]|uniref:non-reducing end alpha-L-arabinofuranosidase n=1 Tax=Amycolatopsis australiensis TaxID=546364 RepID=A0A1K1SI61_9PSEU|nr:LamG-like jellyroll fold domain-containing protein [Amycolatopsis australiensis]SFW83836.1 Concanavalin A-like lectin/glucanases superfamily protein [Amycolatopsis australiensis]
MPPRFRRPLAVLAALTLFSALPVTAAAADPEPGLAGHWTFDEGSGTTAADTAGSHPATLNAGAGWGPGIRGGALTTDGSKGFADAGAPVLDTTKSFSVSSWVKLDRTSGFQTFVSVDGSQVSNFFLQFRDDSRRFAFTRLAGDAPADGVVASASFDPVAGQWYQLTGVYDATASTLSLYVDGTRQATVAAPAAWAGTGDLVIGRGKYGGNPVDFVDGSIDDVRAYSGALTAAEAARLAIAGHWTFDEGSGTTAADDSPDARTATLTGGATWGDGVVGPHGVALNGTDAAADVPAPVVDTAQSFSVSAWVKPTEATGFRTAVSVDGSAISGFYLQRAADGRFAFTRRAGDGDTPSSSAVSALPAQAGQWQHLVGVYDRAAGTLSLYVNGTLQQSVPFTTPWTATGHLEIGRGKWAGNPADWFAGGVDDVRAYPTPLTASAVAALAAGGSWHFDEGTGTVAHDASANAADGTLRGATWTAGASGKAVQLDGKSTVDMGAAPAFDTGTGSLSLAAWFRTTSDGTLAGHGDGYALGVTGGKLTARVGTIQVTTTGGGLADGNWHHAALVLDRASQRLTVYADGDAAAVTSTCGTPTGTTLDVSACPASGTSTAAFTVGSGFTGAVDEVELRRFPLTAAQVGTMAGANQLAVDANVVRASTRPTTYGSILEDISHSVEGGLYAELVRNRTFKEGYQPGSGAGDTPVPYWSLLTSPGATGTYAIDTAAPLNTALDRSLKLHADAVPAGGRVAAANVGYYGVAAKPSTKYTGSFFARGTWTGGVRVSLEKPDGTVLASKDVQPAGPAWTQQTFSFTTPSTIPASTDNRIVVSLVNRGKAALSGDAWFQQVSLFPPTFKNRPNGVRADLGQKLAALKLGLFRVPGGNYLEGNTLDTRFAWKNTIGPLEQRPGHQNTAWGYWSTDGFGILDYLKLAEDIGAQPLLALFAGYTLNGQHVSQADYPQYVQEALDEIEYAIGDATTTWGAKRVADGHPAPFDLHYVEVGNEDWFDGSGSYAWRYTDMYNAIKAKYPQLTVVATTGGLQGGAASSTSTGVRPDAADDHYYQSPQWFTDNSTRYDTADRSGPEILVGEYGAQDGRPTGTLAAAIGEAAFLTGLERNSDVVIGSMYAPVLVHENQANWPVNLIGLDAGSSYGSPSYWVQQMFSSTLGKQIVSSRLNQGSPLRQVVNVTTKNGRKTFTVKLVNPTGQVQTARLALTGVTAVDGTGTLTTLTGDPAARNSLAAPTAIVPQTREITGLAATSKLTLPANSVTTLVITGR